MSEWRSLRFLKGEVFYRGTRFRFPAEYPYEKVVEYMLCDGADDNFPYLFVVSSGYKAGILVQSIPKEACPSGSNGVSGAWLFSQWKKWIYSVDPNKVYVRIGKGRIPRLPV